ncbi:MAG: TonB-dependent receptor [Opitutales bacterium]|nr:TonB-dependent receptor [Opitutales bacterium]
MKQISRKAAYCCALSVSLLGTLNAQDVMEEEDVLMLTPFEVESSQDVGYLATNTLAGTRIRTQLKDVGSAVSVITKEFLEDTGATDNKSLLVYTTNTEVGGSLGNYTGASISSYAEENSFSNPNANTRVRGLTAADNTRNYFLTSIPWDGYNVSRVDLQRGPNSILFGLGSPSGIINNSLATADFYDSREVKVTTDEFGTFRIEGNFNQVILEDELAVHISLLDENEKYKQKEAYEKDQRYYAAVRYKPSFLQTESISTIISANYENGDIERNSPRTVTPIDCISAWFASSEDGAYGLDKQTFDPFDINDNDPDSNAGQTSSAYSDGTVNPNYLPALGNYAQLYGTQLVIFDAGSSTPTRVMDTDIGTYYGIDKNGAIDQNIGGIPYGRIASVAGYSTYAQNAKLENYEWGQYKDYHLTDSSIFDFYNHLLDGNNKTEWQNFEDFSVNLNQTFFNNKVGYELSYDHQDYEQGQESLMSGTRYAIYVDVNETLTDGSENPNVGRAFVSDSLQYANSNTSQERETKKFQAYAEFDFRDHLGQNWMTDILGRHVVSGTISENMSDSETRSWYRYYANDAYRDYIQTKSYADSVVNFTYYISDSLAGANSASGLHLSNISTTLNPSSDSTYMFDSTWNATDVMPGDDWDADENGYVYDVDDDNNYVYYLVNGNGDFVDENGDVTTDSTKFVVADAATGALHHVDGEYQAENPDNYVGWSEMPFTVSEASESDRDSVTYSASKVKKVINSKAFVYQAYLFNEGLVGTYGWRKDKAKSWSVKAKEDNDTKLAILDDDDYSYSDDNYNSVTGETTSWSLVAHVNQLLGKRDFLPFNISLYYSESENFQPESSRVDLRGDSIAPPTGNTVDKSIALSTKDNRYTLKLTKYTTTVLNDTASGLSTWFIGSLESWGGNWCNVFEYNLQNGYTMDGQVAEGSNDGDWRYKYSADVGETEADAAAREAAAIAGWRAHQARVRAEFPTFYENWLNTDPANVVSLSSQTPSGFSITQDTVSEGYEIELIANPTDNWRITFNVSKTEASRSNVGGEAFNAWMDLLVDDLTNTAAGDLRIWSGNPSAGTTYTNFMSALGSSWYLVKLKEGTAVDELRKWHFNLITNYSFDEGWLKGFNVGAGYRWMDRNVIGYPLINGENDTITYDLDNPYHGPSLDYYDFWIGYRHALTDNVDWKIQLNIKNAFTGNELIPLSTQPNGEVAAWYIGARRKISLTNSFTF